MSTVAAWRIDRMPGFRISHPYAAHDPNCPDGPHPTRWCRCRAFRTHDEAAAYVADLETTP